MSALVTWFDPQPAAAELPARMPSPFDHAVHPLARRAAAIVREEIAGAATAWRLDEADGGKMFGVLVVAAPDGRVGFLRGFSGMVDGRWHVPGFVPPLFDEAARDAVWKDGETEMRALAARIDELSGGAKALAARTALAELDARHASVLAALRDRHVANRLARHDARANLAASDDATRHTLAQASRADTAELRRLEAAHAEERASLAAQVAALDDERSALEASRAARSRELLVRYTTPIS